MNKVWNEVQNFEAEFYDKISQIWKKLNLLKYPIMFNRNPKKVRSYPLYLILSIITFNIFSLYWDYLIHIDPDNLYKEIHSAEDTILNAIRNNVKLK